MSRVKLICGKNGFKEFDSEFCYPAYNSETIFHKTKVKKNPEIFLK